MATRTDAEKSSQEEAVIRVGVSDPEVITASVMESSAQQNTDQSPSFRQQTFKPVELKQVMDFEDHSTSAKAAAGLLEQSRISEPVSAYNADGLSQN